MAEKPVGIDLAANQAIRECAAQHPKVYRALRVPMGLLSRPPSASARPSEQNAFGRIIEVNAGFLHSSDLDPNKPINWKRMVEFNGEYGVMGDLGLHVCALPFRAGWIPRNVRAVLSDIVTERPDAQGRRVPCRTWDNATLLCEAVDPVTEHCFPMTLKFHRIAPGQKNTWYLEILGTQASARFSTRNPNRLEWLELHGRRTGVASDRNRARHRLQDNHRRHFRIRLPGFHPPDVGRLSPRAGPRLCQTLRGLLNSL